MKKFTLLLILFTLIKLNSYGQQTPETALKSTSWIWIPQNANLTNASFGTPATGINFGSLNNNPSKIAWIFLPVCDSVNFEFRFMGTPDTIGYAVFGPFQDTVQIANQILNATPIVSRPYQKSFFTNSISVSNLGRGLYYLATNMSSISGSTSITGNYIVNYTRFCDFCENANYLDQSLCLITLDSATNRNKLIYDNSDTNNIDGYVIYRENTIANQFDSLTYCSVDSVNYYIDMSANPSIRNWKYMIHKLDKCGQRLPPYYQSSSYFFRHNTIHLQQGVSTNNSIDLSWNNQVNNQPNPGNGGFIQSFFIYRSDGQSAFQAIDSVPIFADSYTDVNPNQGLNLYKVAMKKIYSCDITSNPNYLAFSNMISTTFTGLYNPVKHNFFKLFPNPAHHEFTVEINENLKDWKLSLYNLQGQEIRVEENILASKIQLNCEDLPAGIYTIKVTSSGTSYFKKLIIE